MRKIQLQLDNELKPQLGELDSYLIGCLFHFIFNFCFIPGLRNRITPCGVYYRYVTIKYSIFM